MSNIDYKLPILCFFIFLIFYFLLEGLRRIEGKTIEIFNYDKDLKKISKIEKIPKQQGDTILLGKNNKRDIYIPTNINHVFVCGTTGSGKTVALSNFMNGAIDYDYPLLMMDGKGDIGNNSILDIVNKLKGKRKLYVIDLNNPKKSDKYNPFKNTSPTVIKDMLIHLTNWTEEHYKLNVERYLQRVIDLLFKAEIPLSFQNIVGSIQTDEFLILSTRLAKEKVITKEEHLSNLELSKSSGRIAEGAIARFSTIIESELGTIFSNDGIDIYTALEEKAILLFILNPLLYPELSPLIGNLIIIDSKKAVSKLYHSNQKRIFFIFDEINVYASKALLDLVNKSRSANVTCVLAAQSLCDLEAAEGEYFKEQIIENSNNYIILRQNSPKNAEQWANIIGTKETMNVTYQLKNDNYVTSDTGMGSARKVREYIVHPDDIKNLQLGKGIIVSKDQKFKCKLTIHKPF